MCICFLCVYICVHVCHKCVGVFGSRKRVSDVLKQHLQAVLNHLALVFGTELRFSGRAVSASDLGLTFMRLMLCRSHLPLGLFLVFGTY